MREEPTKSPGRIERDMLINNHPYLNEFLKENYPEIQNEFDIQVDIHVRVDFMRPPETASAEILRQQLESRLNYKCFTVAEKLREMILNMLVRD